MTHRAEPTAPNGGRAREKPDSQNLQGNILLRADFPSYPVHCTLIWQLLTPVGVTAAPQSPCAAAALQPGTSGKKEALGRCWHMATYHPCSQRVRSRTGGRRAQGGRNVAEGKLEVQCKPQHSQQPSPLGFRNHFKPDPEKCSAAFPSHSAAKSLWLSTSPQRVLQTYHLQDTTNWSIKINLFLRKI